MRSITGRPIASSRLRSWRARELVVAGDQVRVALARERLHLGDLARAEIGVRVRALAALDQLADDRDTGGAQQLAELGEVVALLQRAHAQGALRRALRGLRSVP